MAQFPMGSFFNRNRQNIHHGGQFQQMPGYGMGNMPPNMPMQGINPMLAPRFGGQNFHPQQGFPRGQFPQNFGSNFGGSPPMPSPMPRGQMGQMRQMPVPLQQPTTPPRQQMPPMHLLNPTNDPSVRFEPIPEGMMPPSAQQPAAPSPSSIHQMPPNIPNTPATPTESNAGGIVNKLSDYVQGESNSLIYYENLSKSPRISEEHRELVLELTNNKKQHVQHIAQLYKTLTKNDWVAQDMKIADTRNFKADVAYALLQESRLLREASHIYQNLDSEAHQRIMNSMLHNKIADIAHLMAL